MKIALLAPHEDSDVVRLLARTGGTRVRSPWGLLGARATIVIVRGGADLLREAVVPATLAGARAVLAMPIGEPVALGRWDRRYHRFLFRAQEDARAWGARVALGRTVVVEPAGAPGYGDAEESSTWKAVFAEVDRMATRSFGVAWRPVR